ncbi:MAG TPA: hypothetical protein VG796_18190 [Verrucomicrobiales bacterium]|nr:hypothetical protein [Verrucomicrobiales bacterium]
MTSSNQPASSHRRLVLWLTWIYCLSWAFDFRGSEQGGSAFQLLSFVVTAGTGVLMALVGWRVLFRRPLGWLILLWSVFLASSAVVAVAQHVAPGNYLRTIIPWALVLTSMIACQVAAGFGITLRQVLLPMLIACAINVVWRAFYALVIAGISPEMVRVEMLSQCLPLLMALLMCGLFLQRTWPVWPVILGGLGIASYVFSITRSAIFIIGAAGAGVAIAILVSRRIAKPEPGFAAAKIRHLATGLSILAATFVIIGVATPFVFERWYERVFNPVGGEYTSLDPSTLTRLAETEAFVEILDGDPLNYAFGMGIGHNYYWDERYAVELAYTYGNVDIFRADFREIWFPGHAIWTYAVFSGGFFSLTCHVLFFVLAVGISLRAGKAAVRSGAAPWHLAWLPFCGNLAFISASLTFNPFIERAAGLVLGFIVALPQFLMRDTVKVSAAKKRLAQVLAVPILQREEGLPA